MSEKQVVNLPNGLTLFRMLVLPLLAMLIIREERFWATIVLAVAGLTDLVDGWYARQYKQESSFGKLMDPVADKVLLCVVVLFLVSRSQEPLNTWLGTLLLAREFLITGLRSFAASAGMVFGAGQLGKWKVVFQFFGLGCVILGDGFPPVPFKVIGLVLLWLSVGLSYWSMVKYLRLVYLELSSKNS